MYIVCFNSNVICFNFLLCIVGLEKIFLYIGGIGDDLTPVISGN
jgi:hypothetical protein